MDSLDSKEGNYSGFIVYAVKDEKGNLTDKTYNFSLVSIDYVMGLFMDLYEQEALIFSIKINLGVGT